ncbi:Uncharacterised protein [Mycobacteroides abscessus]|nr:Uncharacterised protein [Mycobacteroides abscessus]
MTSRPPTRRAGTPRTTTPAPPRCAPASSPGAGSRSNRGSPTATVSYESPAGGEPWSAGVEPGSAEVEPRSADTGRSGTESRVGAAWGAPQKTPCGSATESSGSMSPRSRFHRPASASP